MPSVIIVVSVFRYIYVIYQKVFRQTSGSTYRINFLAHHIVHAIVVVDGNK